MPDHGREVRFGYFLIPNAGEPLLAKAQQIERLGLDYIGVSRTIRISAASSTRSRSWP
jgi:hypothetical protein